MRESHKLATYEFEPQTLDATAFEQSSTRCTINQGLQ